MPKLKRYLVVVDQAYEDHPSAPLAGLYVEAFSKREAAERVRRILSEATLTIGSTVYRSAPDACGCSRDRPHVCPRLFGCGWPVPS